MTVESSKHPAIVVCGETARDFCVGHGKVLRDSGFETFAFRGEWSDLRNQIAKGRPLIAGLKPKGGPAHYVVIVGVEAEDVAILLNDPERSKLLRVERNEFAKVWKGTENWTLLAVPRHPE